MLITCVFCAVKALVAEMADSKSTSIVVAAHTHSLPELCTKIASVLNKAQHLLSTCVFIRFLNFLRRRWRADFRSQFGGTQRQPRALLGSCMCVFVLSSVLCVYSFVVRCAGARHSSVCWCAAERCPHHELHTRRLPALVSAANT